MLHSEELMNLPQDISITDQDINWVETILGKDIKFDECRRNIIKNTNSVDIQAFPGTGKTTVLIAKLAILAQKWPYANKGICVLSHTNVAREEIEERLGQTSAGRKLLSYPHFIGTVHSFFDSFVSIPWIQSKGIKIKIIDANLVLNNRWNRLSYATKKYFENKQITCDRCQATALPLKIDIGCSESSNSYKNLYAIIEKSHLMGEFTFDEMLLFASDAMNNNPSMTTSMQNRFPVVFIDEAQDTSLNQWSLIHRAFPDESDVTVRQSFGDSNQAIFNTYQPDKDVFDFPRRGALTIANSKRFNQSIAHLANCLSLKQSGLIGTANDFEYLNDQHTIFLFDNSDIASVITAYAQHALECFSDEVLYSNRKYGCHVIGMVHSFSDIINPKKFPRSVSDYWCDYNANLIGIAATPQYLIEYFRLGNQAFYQNGDTDELINWIAKGLRRFINANGTNQIPSTANAFRTLCQILTESEQLEFRKALFDIIFMDISNSDCWRDVIDKVGGVMTNVFKRSITVKNMLDWKPINCTEDNTSKENFYAFTDDKSQRSIQMEFGSIHSVKGRTHLSTLIVDTFWYASNIKSLLPWLCNIPPKKIGIQNATRMKCHYVGLTRAKGLVCMALPKDCVEEAVREKLVLSGWKIKIL